MIEGEWVITVKGPTGPMKSDLVVKAVDGVLTGTQSDKDTSNDIDEITYDADSGELVWFNEIAKPMKLKLQFTGKVVDDAVAGKVKVGMMGSYNFEGVRK